MDQAEHTQASLKAAQANGNNRVTFEIGPDGMPVPIEAEPEEHTVRIFLPDNGRGDYHGKLWPEPNRNGNGDGGDENN